MHSRALGFSRGRSSICADLRDRFGKFELAGVDALQIGVPPGPRRGAAFRGRPERLQVHIFDAGFLERGRAAVIFEKPGRRDSGSARTSITRSTPAFCSAATNSGTVVPS